MLGNAARDEVPGLARGKSVWPGGRGVLGHQAASFCPETAAYDVRERVTIGRKLPMIRSHRSCRSRMHDGWGAGDGLFRSGVPRQGIAGNGTRPSHAVLVHHAGPGRSDVSAGSRIAASSLPGLIPGRS